jgi:type II secretory pathway component GspD/PulD (secretin)
VEFFSVITCKKFILPVKVTESYITLTSLTAISTPAAYRAFEAALESKGLAMVPAGKFLKIVKGNNKSGDATTNTPDQTDPIKTVALYIHYANATSLAEVLQAFTTKEGKIIADIPTNGLIISDRSSNIEQLTKIVNALNTSHTGDPPSTATPKSPARLELTFTEEKSSATYKLTTPDKSQPSRLELRGPEQDLYIEFVWLKDGSALQYNIKRTTFGKSGSTVVDLSGTIGLPTTGKTSLINTPGLNLELGFTP